MLGVRYLLNNGLVLCCFCGTTEKTSQSTITSPSLVFHPSVPVALSVEKYQKLKLKLNLLFYPMAHDLNHNVDIFVEVSEVTTNQTSLNLSPNVVGPSRW